MLLRNLMAGKNAVRSGGACVVCGLMLLQASISLGRSQTLLVHGSVDTRDFVRGFLIGFALVIELLGIVILARRKGGQASR